MKSLAALFTVVVMLASVALFCVDAAPPAPSEAKPGAVLVGKWSLFQWEFRGVVTTAKLAGASGFGSRDDRRLNEEWEFFEDGTLIVQRQNGAKIAGRYTISNADRDTALEPFPLNLILERKPKQVSMEAHCEVKKGGLMKLAVNWMEGKAESFKTSEESHNCVYFFGGDHRRK